MIALTTLLAISGAAIGPTEPPAAIVRRHDRPDSLYQALARRFAAVGTIGRVGAATLIAPRWAVTAAHVVRDMARLSRKPTIRFAAREYDVLEVYVHPRWDDAGPHDIALLKLSADVASVVPIPLYRSDRETGVVAFLVGAGLTGTGRTRERAEDFHMRAATSAVDSADAWSLYFSFDAPPSGTDLEGAAGSGDSGGPAVLLVDDEMFVAGIGSAGYAGDVGQASYGAVDIYTRASSYAAWADDVMSEQCEPSWTRERGRSVTAPAAPPTAVLVSVPGAAPVLGVRQRLPTPGAGLDAPGLRRQRRMRLRVSRRR